MQPKPIPRTAQVLLVEDNVGDILLIREALQKSRLAMNLNIVTDGEEALAYLNAEGKHAQAPRPDFILLDLNLPRMDGRMFLRRVRSHPDFKKLPVVVLTSSHLDSDMREVGELRIDRYMVKPGSMLGFLAVARGLKDFWAKLEGTPSF